MSGDPKTKQPGDLVALRTIPFADGFIEKGEPVPGDVAGGDLREWQARGWVGPAEREPRKKA